MAKDGGKEEVGRFQFRTVQRADDIPSWVWKQALPELKRTFRTIQNAGDIPNEGGTVSVTQAPPRDKWHNDFCAVLSQFDGREQSVMATV